MTTPITSAYDPDPWEPTIDTNSDESDQQAAAKQYTDLYGGSATIQEGGSATGSASNPKGAAVPTLAAAYTQAPDFVPADPGHSGWPGGSATGGPSPEIDWAPTFYIELSALRSAEQKFLNATSTVMDGYETLRTTVTSAISAPNTFGQEVGTLTPTGYSYEGPQNAPYVPLDPLDSEGSDIASAIGPQMQQLLAAVGGVIEAWGVFNALLNNTGQMYAYTDQQSSFGVTPMEFF